MAELTIVRHAEAEGNFYRRAHGQYNSLLTPNGEAQVAALRERFRDTVFDAVYTSDLYRARRTASALRAADGRPPLARPALRETHLGDWEDVPWGELAVKEPDKLAVFMHTPGLFARRGASGESMPDTQARLLRAARDIAAAHPNGRVALVSHGLAIRALMAALEGLPPERLHEIPHCDNTAVARVEWDGVGAPVVHFRNDNSHVGELTTLGRQHWWRKNAKLSDTNLWFRAAEMPRERPTVLDCLRDAWMTVYGTMAGFNDEISAAHTERMAAAHPRAVVFAMRERAPVGLLQLDTEVLTPDNTGHVSLVYLKPEARGLALGAQLLGHAVSVYRALGRRALHLRVARTNAAARRLYEKMGFREAGRESGAHGALLVMKMDIALPDCEYGM